MKWNWEISSVADYKNVIVQLLDKFKSQKIYLFDAPMGAGKTTLIKEFCKQLGSTGNFSSPTFSIVNEYPLSTCKIFHFDLYRIEKEEELLNIGFDEYIASTNYCFIEWPEKAIPFLKGEKVVSISITPLENGVRSLTAELKEV